MSTGIVLVFVQEAMCKNKMLFLHIQYDRLRRLPGPVAEIGKILSLLTRHTDRHILSPIVRSALAEIYKCILGLWDPVLLY